MFNYTQLSMVAAAAAAACTVGGLSVWILLLYVLSQHMLEYCEAIGTISYNAVICCTVVHI